MRRLTEKGKVEFTISPRAISEETPKSVENMLDYRKDKLAIRTAKAKIITAGLVLGVIFVIFSGYLAKQYIGETEEQRLSNLKQIVQLARNSIEPILVEYRSKQISKAQALEQVRNLVRRMVYKDQLGKNYVFMSSYDGTMLVQPFEPRREMTNMWNLRDAYGVYIIRELIKTAESKNGSGYVSYYYKRPSQTKPEEKISFVIGIPEMNCYIGTGKYMTDIRKAERAYIISITSLTFLLMVLLAILVLSSMREVRRQNLMLQQEYEVLKQAEEALASSEEFLNNVIEQSPVSLWISDSEGTLIKLNQSCRELFGATDEETVGKYNLFKDNLIEEQGFIPLVENVFEKGEIARFTIDYDLPRVEHVKVNGATHRILDVIVSPIKDIHGKVTNAIVQHKDITEAKKAEEELRQHREHLEEMVRERTAELRTIVKAMSGREVRMAELKETIQKLRAQLEETGLTPVADDPLKKMGKETADGSEREW